MSADRGAAEKFTPRRSRGALRGKLVLAALAVLVLASGFNLLLHLSSLQKMWLETLTDGARVVAVDLEANVQRSVRYGKRLDKFVGMDDLLDEALGQLKHQDPRRRVAGSEGADDSMWRVEIAEPGGRVLYCTDPARVGVRAAVPDAAGDVGSFADGDRQVVRTGLRDAGGGLVGSVLVSFSRDAVTEDLRRLALSEMQVGGLVFLAAGVLFWLSLFLVLPRERGRLQKLLGAQPGASEGGAAFPRKGLLWSMLVAVVLCQVVYSLYAALEYKTSLEGIVRGKVVAVSSILRADLEYVASKGVSLERLPRIEDAMARLLATVPEAASMRVADAGNRTLRQVGAEARPDDMPVRVPLLGPGGGPLGSIVAFVPQETFRAQLRTVVLDSLTILVIALLFAVELAIMVLDYFQRAPAGGGAGPDVYKAVRPAGFLMLFGADSSLSFIPLHMKGLAGGFLGLPKELLVALPISVEMFCAGLMIALSGGWIDRLGWRRPLLAGLGLCLLGFAGSWAASGPMAFLAARGLVGLGYGLALMSMQGFVVRNTDEHTRGQGFARFWAGVYAGSVCGVAAGALVAQQLGYGPVFLFGAAMLAAALAYCATALSGLESGASAGGGEAGAGKGARGYGAFLVSRDVLFTVLLANIPAALAIIGLLNYYTPVYLDDLGVSQGDIGRIFMLNSLAIILVAQFAGGSIDRTEDKRGWIVLGGVLGAASFLLFCVLQGVTAVLAAVILLGASSSIALTAIGPYVLGLDASARLGSGRATAMVASTYRVGQVLGPVLFGWLAAFDAKTAMPLVGGVYLLLSLAYPLVVRRGRG